MPSDGSAHIAAAALAVLLSAGALVVLPAPEASADVIFVPVVFVQNNTLGLDLTVLGGSVLANVTREFILNETQILDELFVAGVNAPGSVSLSARPEEPEGASLNTSAEGFNITFGSMTEGKAELPVRYTYSVRFDSVGALNFTIRPSAKDEVNPMYEILVMSVSDFSLRVHSNIPVSVFNGTGFQNGTDVNVSEWNYQSHYPFGVRWQTAPCLVCWSDGPEGRVNETLFSRFLPEHRPMMENLIQSESVNITIGQGTDLMPYRLDGKFILNGSLLRPFDTVWLWFPNNITCATAEMDGEPCKIEPSVRDGQAGFYIRARYEYFGNTTLVVNITGNLSDRRCDFFIVTVPAENSSVRYILHPGFRVTAQSSPFEEAVLNETADCKTLEFRGRCTGRGPVHVEWAPDEPAGAWIEASLGNVNADSARIEWNTSGNPDFLEYRIHMSEQAGWTGALAGRVVVQTQNSCEIGNLSSNTTYYFSVRKLLAGNRTAYSNTVEARTLAYPLSAPKLIVYYREPDGDVPVLRWTRCDNPDFASYELFQSDAPDRPGQSVFRTADRSVLEREFSSLHRNTNYYFTLRVSTGTNGRADSPVVQVFIPPAGQGHFNLSVTRRSDDPETASLRWEASNATDFNCYEVYMSTGAGALGERLTRITERTLVEYTAGGLSPFEDGYFFTVRTVTNRSGSMDSNQVWAKKVIVDTSDKDGPLSLEGPWAAIGIGAIALVAVLVTAVVMRARKRGK
jgi:hypothetical protein